MKKIINLHFSYSTLIFLTIIFNMIIFGGGIVHADKLKALKNDLVEIQTENIYLNLQVASLTNHDRLEYLADSMGFEQEIKPTFLKTYSLAQLSN